MPAAKRLLTGPHGASPREALLRMGRREAAGLWIVPTPLARRQILSALRGAWGSGPDRPRVWCWCDLWAEIRGAADGGPSVLSAAGARALLHAATDEARKAGALASPPEAVQWPGYRRRLRDRVALWTLRERSPDGEPPAEADPTTRDAWDVYGRYRRALARREAVDPEGLAAWASRVLESDPPEGFRRFGEVTIVDPGDAGPAVRRALGAFERRARQVRVGLAYLPDPALAEAQGDAPRLREALRERGYRETALEEPVFRPSGLRDVERRLFREGGWAEPPWRSADGLRVVGGPQGEGRGLRVARSIREALDEGVPPEDVLVVVPRWDDDAETVVRVARGWGLPVAPAGRARRLASDPGVSAVRLALEAASGEVETAHLIRLLRSGRFRPDWPGLRAPNLAARAASAVHATRVFRGADRLRTALDRAIEAAGEDRHRRDDATAVRDLVGRLLDELAALAAPGPFARHAGRLRALARSLGFDRESAEPDEPGGGVPSLLDEFWEALEDQASALGPKARPIGPAEFAEEVGALADDLAVADAPPPPGSVVVATVDDAAGARGRVVILANLAEGTFPTREAAAPGAPPGAYAREAARFARVAGSAEDRLVLAYPTRDAKGQELLPAGFLDDLRRAIAPAALARIEERHERFDPALVDREDLALAPGDARARAVALAFQRRYLGPLRRLAADPTHRDALLGAAAAMGLRHHRTSGRDFTPYEGRLTDPAALAVVARRLGPDFRFTASQLESYLYCPFQFFLRHVLGLAPVDERDELDEDYAGRGTRIHSLLERLEQARAMGEAERPAILERLIEDERDSASTTLSEIEAGRHLIEVRRLERSTRRYLRQSEDYERAAGAAPPRPAHFEVGFGRPEDPHESLTVGDGDRAVRLRGVIDRIDVVETPDGLKYRVIDYKTGKVPSRKEIEALDKLQLAIYALAAERVVLARDGAAFDEAGYWAIEDGGYARAVIDWPTLYEGLERRLLETVGQLRGGWFVVRPRSKECTKRCDFATVCRIGQVRRHRLRAPDAGDDGGGGS